MHSMRWHHPLEPTVEKRDLQNALPHCCRHFFHPTRATLTRDGYDDFKWKSRNHRKQRHKALTPGQRPRRGKNLQHRFAHMSRLEYWNISWWVAMAFTTGSVIWVINGFFSFLPLVNSDVMISEAGLGWTAFVGATIFEAGSILGILEAWNREDAADFGWNFYLLHHKNTANDIGSGHPEKPSKQWIWFTMDTKYFHELGFLAAFFQLLAASVFWISGFTAIPGIYTAIIKHTGVLDGTFWTPQVVGGCGFIISSTLIMLEAQKAWYKPNVLSLGWQIGFWNFIGAIGFTLCGALGYGAQVSSGVSYQSSLSTFWGGWAFLIASVMQWYEAVNSVVE
ncbi:hypothetical protein H2248_011608 [Termitomyces sp. 'cryptogamus']|nr:hypothetical protein H2248_011608 [Termitomyces sp. 'cryptogamus']